MIKTNYLILILIFSSSAFSEEKKEELLYQKVFGKKSQVRTIALPIFWQDKYLGDTNVEVENDKIISFQTNSLVPVLKNVLTENEIKRIIGLKKDKLIESDLSFKLEYKSSELKLNLIADQKIIRPNDTYFQEDLIPYYAQEALRPSVFGGAINWKAERSFSIRDSKKSYNNLYLNSFFNYKTFVLENNLNYTDEDRSDWTLGNTTIVHDDEKRLIRYSVGDVSNTNVGYLAVRTFGGVSLSKDYDINPYKLNNPASNTEFEIQSKSLVRYYINNSLIKSEYLNAGKYSVKNLPLNNGINNIIVEVENEFGEKKIFNFKESFSSELLGQGDSKFDLTAGYVSSESNGQKKYQTNKGIGVSGFYKYGITSQYSASVYSQARSSYRLIGAENILASSYGNWTYGVGHSTNTESGIANYLGYSLTSINSYLGSSQNLNLRAELRAKKFSDSFEYSSSRFKYNLNLSYSLPLTDIITVGTGGQYSIPYEQSYSNKYSIDFSITGQILKNSTITMFSNIVRDEYRNWNQYYYVFLNFSFPENSSYVSSYYESQSKTKKISLYHDRGEVINALKVQANVEETRYGKDGDIDLQYNTRYADFGLDQIVKYSDQKYTGRTNVRMLSSLLMASNGDRLRFSLSRPTSNSFAMINQSGELRNYKLFVKNSDNGGTQTETSFDKKLIVNDLTPYQYRRLQIDLSQLPVGYSLEKESFVLFPTYKSAHLIDVSSNGSIGVTGRFLNLKGEPMSYKVGKVVLENGQEYPFFTNKLGRFLIESLKSKSGKFYMNDSELPIYEFKIDQETGIVDLKELKINYEQ